MTNRTEGVSEHHRAWDNIPWVVNGSASDAQRRAVEAHARDCADCRDELARQRELQAAMAHEPAAVTDPAAGLRHLWKRIDQAADDSASAAGSRPPGRHTGRRSGAGVLIFGLTIAVVVEAIGISVLGVGLLSRITPAPSYETLSDSADHNRGATIRVVPAASMSLGELQALLVAQELQVVAGPNAVGAYALAPLSAGRSLDKQLASLRAEPGMRLVEPILAREPGR